MRYLNALGFILFLLPGVMLSQIVNSYPDSTPIDLGSSPHTYVYTGSYIITDTAQAYQKTTRVLTNYTQTYTYSGANLITHISQWIQGDPVGLGKSLVDDAVWDKKQKSYIKK